MSTFSPLPLDRLYLLNQGEKLTIGDRTLAAYKPPIFDNPSTTAFLDESSGAASAPLLRCAAARGAAAPLATSRSRSCGKGVQLCATVDSPWLSKADDAKLAKELDGIRAMKPEVILSSHLPVRVG